MAHCILQASLPLRTAALHYGRAAVVMCCHLKKCNSCLNVQAAERSARLTVCGGVESLKTHMTSVFSLFKDDCFTVIVFLILITDFFWEREYCFSFNSYGSGSFSALGKPLILNSDESQPSIEPLHWVPRAHLNSCRGPNPHTHSRTDFQNNLKTKIELKSYIIH